MRKHLPLSLTANRIRHGEYGSDDSYGFAGAFKVIGPTGLLVLMSSGIDHENGWEHVSVSADKRTPTWREMCFVKDLFWDETECVIQFHPPKSEYVNFHPHCLHMWRPIVMTIPMPSSLLVGPKRRGA